MTDTQAADSITPKRSTASGHRWTRFSIARLLLALLVVAVVVSLVRQGLIRHQRSKIARAEHRNLTELAAFSMALDRFRYEHGFVPQSKWGPQAIIDAIRIRGRFRPGEPIMLIDDKNLDSVDDSEALVFWLSGGAETRIFRRPHEAYFEFEPRRLVDSDNDGWPEYTGRDGQTFRYIDGQPAIYCPETSRMITLEVLVND